MSDILQKAIIMGIFSSFAAAIMGSYVVIKRISSISGSIAHSILGGIGIFVFLQYKLKVSWLNPVYGALLAALAASLLIGWMHLKYKQKEDATIAATWSTGMGLGVIFISFVPHSGHELHHFLFGNILNISTTDIHMLMVFDVIIFLFVAFFYSKFLFICFDEEQASLGRIHINSLYLLLLALISVAVVLLIQVIGIILVIALLTIPPTIALMFTKRLLIVMGIAFVLCATLTTIGSSISFYFNYPPGAATAILASILYIFALMFRKTVVKKFY